MAKQNTSASKEDAPVVETPVEETPEVVETPVEETPEVVETPVEETPEVETPVEETPPHVVAPEKPSRKKKLGTTKGVIANCNALRLREGANIRTRELAQIPAGTEVVINLDNSTESFYEVSFNNGSHDLVGYCLKDYIKIG